MQTIVIVGMLVYSLSYLTTAFLLRHSLSKESNSEPVKAFDFSNRHYKVNAINIGVTVLAMVFTYFSGVS
jgi:hypothetical protein